MSLSIGIVGLPNVGKSTLFNALTQNNVLAANYPFATIEPNEGIVPLPDPRIPVLVKMYDSEKQVPAPVKFVDIAGIVSGAHKGEGMGNAFLSHIRETDAIVQVVRAFEDDDIQHVDESVDPTRDIETIKTELILADLQTIEKHLPKLAKEARADKSKAPALAALEQAQSALDSGQLISEIDDFDEQLGQISYLQLLSAKRFIYLFNVDEDGMQDLALQKKLAALAPSDDVLFMCAKVEAEIAQLDGDDRQMFMDEYNMKESGLERLARVGFKALGLQTYLTAGPTEVKAWTIKAGSTAPQAAGVIHGDFERGFIAAEIVDYDDLIEAGSEQAAKSAGKVRTEGKTYLMQPGDIVEFKFNT